MNIDAFDVALTILGLSMLLALARAAIGPSLPDRVIGLELTSMIAVGIILVKAVSIDAGYLIDVAIVLALVAFMASVTFAYYLERRPPE